MTKSQRAPTSETLKVTFNWFINGHSHWGNVTVNVNGTTQSPLERQQDTCIEHIRTYLHILAAPKWQVYTKFEALKGFYRLTVIAHCMGFDISLWPNKTVVVHLRRHFLPQISSAFNLCCFLAPTSHNRWSFQFSGPICLYILTAAKVFMKV
jgi:hypothetical protein